MNLKPTDLERTGGLQEEIFPLVDKLKAVLADLKSAFVGKDDIIDLMGLCLVSRENLFLLGPPGTAKSALVNELGKRLDGKTFEYLLTRFTEPNELFGPFDIRKLREGDLVTNTEGMLPEASLIFLDELLNANSAILNSLLMVLNERVFRRGRENRALPALMIVGASNHLPEDEALQALFDRFLVRVRSENVDPADLPAVLDAGWQLEHREIPEGIGIAAGEIRQLQSAIRSVDLSPVREPYLETVQKLRNAGVQVSDRRAVKLQRLIAGSALISKRNLALKADLWVLRYVWDAEEQAEIIAGIVNQVVESDGEPPNAHPQAFIRATPDPDQLYTEVTALETSWKATEVSLSEKARIKDRLRYLSGRAEWIPVEVQRDYVQQKIDALWKEILQEQQ